MISMIDDLDTFTNEISEQIYLANMKLKYQRLNEKDFVRKRINEKKLHTSQVNYLENFTGQNPEWGNINTKMNVDLHENIQELVKLNEMRRIKMKKETNLILDEGYNRII